MPDFHHAREGRQNNFGLIRHVAALAVVLTHSYSIVSGQFETEPLARMLGHSVGNYAVDVFFVLSGYLITQSLSRNGDLLRFVVSRTARIFPALILSTLLCAFVLGPVVTDLPVAEYFSDKRVYGYVIGVVTTLGTGRPLPGVFENLPTAGEVNVPLWTLQYELAVYTTLGLLVWLSHRTRIRSIFGTALLLCGTYVFVRVSIPWPSPVYSPISDLIHFMLSFYLGSCAFILRHSMPLSTIGIACLLLCAALAHDTPVRELFEKMFVAYTVLWVAFAVPPVPLRSYGDYSFGLYIFTYPVQQLTRTALPDIQPLELFLVSLLFALPIAMISWHVIEAPCLSRREAIAQWLRGAFCRAAHTKCRWLP